MFDSRDDLKQMLKGDLMDFLVLFLFKKYLSAFSREHIGPITNAIANAWKNRMHNSSMAADQKAAMELIQQSFGISINDQKESKKQSEAILREEIETVSRIIYGIGEDSLKERILIDNSLRNQSHEKNN